MQSERVHFRLTNRGCVFASWALCSLTKSCAGWILIRSIGPSWVHFEILLPNLIFLIKLQMKRMPEVWQAGWQATNKTLISKNIAWWELTGHEKLDNVRYLKKGHSTTVSFQKRLSHRNHHCRCWKSGIGLEKCCEFKYCFQNMFWIFGLGE